MHQAVKVVQPIEVTARDVVKLRFSNGDEVRISPQPDGRLNLDLPGRWHVGGLYSGDTDTSLGLVPDRTTTS